MGYALTPYGAGAVVSRSRRDRLGNPLIVAQAAVAVASQASGIISGISHLFNPGASRDADRLARANFFRDAAKVGSITAGRYLLGGLQTVAGNEKPYYQDAIAAVSQSPSPGPEVMQAASVAGAKWNTNDVAGDGSKHAMIDDVATDLHQLAIALPTPVTPSGTTTTPPIYYNPGTTTPVHPTTMLPGMVTTAGFNYTPWLLGGAAVLLVPMLMRKLA